MLTPRSDPYGTVAPPVVGERRHGDRNDTGRALLSATPASGSTGPVTRRVHERRDNSVLGHADLWPDTSHDGRRLLQRRDGRAQRVLRTCSGAFDYLAARGGVLSGLKQRDDTDPA